MIFRSMGVRTNKMNKDKYKYLYTELKKYVVKADAPWEGGPSWQYWDGMSEAYENVRKKLKEIEQAYAEIYEGEVDHIVDIGGGD